MQWARFGGLKPSIWTGCHSCMVTVAVGCPSPPPPGRSFGLWQRPIRRCLQYISSHTSDRLLYRSHGDATQMPSNLTSTVKSFKAGKGGGVTLWLRSLFDPPTPAPPPQNHPPPPVPTGSPPKKKKPLLTSAPSRPRWRNLIRRIWDLRTR